MNSLWRSVGLVALALVIPAHAAIYTWVDSAGVRHYSDAPTGQGAERADLPGIQSVAGTPPDAARVSAGQGGQGDNSQTPPDARSPTLVQPESGTTLRDAQGRVPVAVSIGGSNELRPGEQLTYYLDASPVAQSPTDKTRLTLADVPRGAHTLSVALLYQGRELRRTQTATFYMKQPAAISPLNRQTADGANNPDSGLKGAPVAPPAGNTSGAPSAPRINIGAPTAGPSVSN